MQNVQTARVPARGGRSWTDAQLTAIESRGKNLLVSASAGSGKTAVLVERVVRLLCEGACLNEMLIVTFTNAAASEMRERLFEALMKGAESGERALAEQIAWVDRADIRTLHSLCSNIIRAHFQAAQTDPMFRMLDDALGQRLRADAMRGALIEWYGGVDQSSEPLMRCLTPEQNEKAALQLYSFLMARPDPWRWFDKTLEGIPTDGAAFIECGPINAYLKLIALRLESIADEFTGLASYIARMPGGNVFAAVAYADADRVRSMAYHAKRGYMAYHDECVKWDKWDRKPAVKAADAKQTSELFSLIRDPLRKRADAEMTRGSFARDPDAHAADSAVMKSQLRAVGNLTRLYEERYAALKDERACLDYNDLEQRALQALSDERVSESLRQQYAHIFVDEYQDSSPLQEGIVNRIARGDNLFLVGDVKQSIYRFREADPTLFLKKYQSFPSWQGGSMEMMPDSANLRVDLDRNYRSSPTVLNAVNSAFASVQRASALEIDYDENAAMKPGRVMPEGGALPELHVVWKRKGVDESTVPESADDGNDGEDSNADDEEELTAIESEAAWAALRILELCSGDEGEKYSFSDIALLMRAPTGKARRVADILRDCGVSVDNVESIDFTEQIEVMRVVDILRVLDNPENDMAMLSALAGPALGLDDAALAEIKIRRSNGSYYEAAREASESTGSLGGACAAFFERIEGWRGLARILPPAELISRIVDDTSMYARLGALPDGPVRQANLRALTQLAARYQEDNGGGLSGFIAALDHQAGAAAVGVPVEGGEEHTGGVRIMSVHASKGLQYPVVIVLGCGSKFNKDDAKKTMLLNDRQGAAMKTYNPANMTWKSPIFVDAVKAAIQRDALSEEARVLYVAMTRAQDRLLVYGTTSELEKFARGEGGISDSEIVGASCALDWVLLSLRGKPEQEMLRIPTGIEPSARAPEGESVWRISVHSFRPPRNAHNARVSADELPRQESRLIPETILDAIPANNALEFYAPPATPPALYKQTVTGIAHQSVAADDLYTEKPGFARHTGEATASERGSEIHIIMAGIEPRLACERGAAAVVRETVKRLTERGMLMDGEAADKEEAIVRFFESGLGERMIKSNEVLREQPFNFVFDAEGETLVQGVIDCCFIEDGEWVVVDYKTDKVTAPEELLRRYKAQVDMYAEALGRITGKAVRAKAIYSFHLGKAIYV